MLVSVSADGNQAMIVQVKFQKPEVVVQDERHRHKRRLRFRSRNESKGTLCQRRASEPGGKY